MLKVALPSGSLEEPTLRLFEAAGLEVTGSPRQQQRSIACPWISPVVVMSPQIIPRLVEQGNYDVGITGLDCVAESESLIWKVEELPYSKSTTQKSRVVIIASEDNPVSTAGEIKPDSAIVTEYPNLTRCYFEKSGISVNIVQAIRTAEAHVPHDFPYAVCVSETGTSLKANHLKIVDVVMETMPILIANPQAGQDSERAKYIRILGLLLQGAIVARDYVLLVMNVAQERLEEILVKLPALKAPTISPLTQHDYVAVQTVVPKAETCWRIPELLVSGAEGLLVIPISLAIRSWQE